MSSLLYSKRFSLNSDVTDLFVQKALDVAITKICLGRHNIYILF